MYLKEVEIIWANLDPNQHTRHTAYSDYATHARISFFLEHGFTMQDLAALGFAPVLLREQTTFFREVGMHERIKISVELDRCTENYSHYTIVQYFYKENKKKAAKVVIDGTWIDLKTRQATIPSATMILEVLDKMTKTPTFKVVSAREYMFL